MKQILTALVLMLALAAAPGCKNKTPEPSPGAGSTVEETSDAGGICAGSAVIEGLTAARPPAGETPSDGDMLVRRLPAEPGTLNTLIATDISELMINYHQVMETLLDTDLDTGELTPLLAESYEVSDDKMTFTFHLRKGVTWHDGKPFTADDVIYSIERVLDPKVDAASLRSYFLDCDSYEKLDDYTVQVKWKKPYFKAPEVLGDFAIVPKHILDDGTDFNQHPFGRQPVGTGPYRLVEWKTGQSVLLSRYEGYWGPRPHFERIMFKVITDDDVALQVFKKGELDTVGLSRIQWVKQTGSKDFAERFHKLHFHYPAYSYIGWNMRKPMFADRRVRQALTMLLNREAILKQIYYCLGTIVSGTFDYQSPFGDPAIKPWPFDPERAKALLAEAGWKDTDGDGLLDKDGQPFRFELSFTAAVPEWEQIAVIYQEDLKKVGIDMVIRKLEWAVFLENVQQWKFDASAMAWALDFNPDPYQLWHSSQADIVGSSNHVGFKNDEVDRLIEENREEFDRDKRIVNTRRIHKILHEEQPYIFLFSAESLMAADKRIHNVVPHPIRPIFYYTQWYVPKEMQKYQDLPGP